MDLGTVLSAVQTLFAALQCKELQDMLSFMGYRSQLEGLQRTVTTVKAVLLDAEKKEVDSDQARLWIDELKDAVYEADDLFDKFVTTLQRKKLKNGGKATKKVRLFLSRYNPFGIAKEMSQGVKEIRKKLDDIADNHNKFGFKIDPQPIRLRREETCSYVLESDIIGREGDVEKIVEYLLNDTKKQVSFLTIVGMGGLGKTALAQLVYNDARVTCAFPLRIWTCVSDHEQDPLDVEHILRKILIAATDTNQEVFPKELLQKKVRGVLRKQKFLLVLDDVWTEKRNQWLELEKFLIGDKQGSWIVLTTRSHETARIAGDNPIKHELQGLSKEKSWCLFEKVAFGSGQSSPSEELVKIGQEIVEDCARVPLAIKVVGSLLYGQDKSNWLSFKRIGISHSPKSKNDVMPILQVSYNQLESSVKSCFTYCALFPKDYELDVTRLKRLWMAQGYIVTLNDGQSMEEAAEEYVSILLRRCFFQDVKYDKDGDIRSCKIHDLMHDIALKVAEKEICVRNFTINDVNKTPRHLAYTSSEFAQLSFTETQLRSCLYVGRDMHKEDGKMYQLSTSILEGLLSKWKCLRALDLRYSGIKCLQESIGELLHLRYLDLHKNQNLEVLPKSLIKLYNLQTLLLGGCMKLKELPKDFIKLVNLRTLVIEECGIRNLTCLGTLPQLKFLKLLGLVDLEYIDEDKGEVGGSISVALPDGRLMTAQGLLSFPFLEMLQLVYLPRLKGWGNSRVEEIGDSSSNITPMLLPQLKTLIIERCENMKCKLLLPNLEVLDLNAFNESLKINRLSKETRGTSTSTSTTSCSSCYCYSLPKLKKVSISGNVGWLKRMPVESLQCLEKLSIRKDKEIESIGEVEEVFRSCSSSLLSLEIFHCPKLRRLISGGLGYLSALQFLSINNCEVLSLSEEEERARNGIIGMGLPPSPRFVHSLRRLRLQFLPELVNLPNWMQYLSALRNLKIIYCEGLETMPDWIANIPSIYIKKKKVKVVLKVDIHDDKKYMRKAMKLIFSVPGVQSISFDTRERLITITGNMDPVKLVRKFRKKKYCVCIKSVGPA